VDRGIYRGDSDNLTKLHGFIAHIPTLMINTPNATYTIIGSQKHSNTALDKAVKVINVVEIHLLNLCIWKVHEKDAHTELGLHSQVAGGKVRFWVAWKNMNILQRNSYQGREGFSDLFPYLPDMCACLSGINRIIKGRTTTLGIVANKVGAIVMALVLWSERTETASDDSFF
jgi:hypothetical protein